MMPEQLAAALRNLPKSPPTTTGAADSDEMATHTAVPHEPTGFPQCSGDDSAHLPLSSGTGADGLICPICQKFIRGGRSALTAHQLTSSMCRATRGDQQYGREPCQYCGKMLAADDAWARQQHAAFCTGQTQQSSWRPYGNGPPAAESESNWRPKGGPPVSWRPKGGPPASSWRPQGGPPASSWRPQGGPPASSWRPHKGKGKSGWYYWPGY